MNVRSGVFACCRTMAPQTVRRFGWAATIWTILFVCIERHMTWSRHGHLPGAQESDLIQAFDESATFEDQLIAIFDTPAPWVPIGTYAVENLEVYFEANQDSTHPSPCQGGAQVFTAPSAESSKVHCPQRDAFLHHPVERRPPFTGSS